MKEGNFMKIVIGISLIIAVILILMIFMVLIEIITDKIHNDRMPDNLSPRDEWRWKNGGID